MLVDPVDINLLLGSGVSRRFVRIDAYRDDFILIARRELHHAESAGLTRQLLAAQHRAGVVDQVQNHRTAGLEVIAESYRLSGLILELEIERQLLIQPLIDPDVLEL